MRGAIPPLPNKPSWRGAQLKHRKKNPRLLSSQNSAILNDTVLEPMNFISENKFYTFFDLIHRYKIISHALLKLIVNNIRKAEMIKLKIAH
jgi:hypothetical protein